MKIIQRLTSTAGVWLIVMGWLAGEVLAAASFQPVAPVRSSSDQFLIYGVRSLTHPLAPPTSQAESRTIWLAPDLVAISCERVKQTLLRELGLPDRWRMNAARGQNAGRIHVRLRPQVSTNEPIIVVSHFFTDGWQYQIELPEQVEELKVLRAIVQALLLELANRNAGSNSAELPLWLAEGMTHHLQAIATSDLIIPGNPPTSRAAGNNRSLPGGWLVSVQPGAFYQGRKRDDLIEARRQLSTNAPLTFTELSLPAAKHLSGPDWEVYRRCAHLFVRELLSLQDGRGCLLSMMQILPQYLNWQTAFFLAFQSHFQVMLDVEKWWALRLANFTGHNEPQGWTLELGLEKLGEALSLSAHVSMATNELPKRAEFTLQQAIQEWDFARQRQNLQRTIAQLRLIRTRAAPALRPLVDDYEQTLRTYLRKREEAGVDAGAKGANIASIHLIERDVIKRLKNLDEQRAALRGRTTAAATLPKAPNGN